MKRSEIAALFVGPAAAFSFYLLVANLLWGEPVTWVGALGAVAAGLVGAAAGGTVVEAVVIGGIVGILTLIMLAVWSPPLLVRHGFVGLVLGGMVGMLTDAVFGAFRKVDYGDRPPGR